MKFENIQKENIVLYNLSNKMKTLKPFHVLQNLDDGSMNGGVDGRLLTNSLL